MYENGNCVPQDYTKAVKWYTLAAEQGIVGAQSNLGGMYYSGEGVVQDFVLAHMWHNISAGNGNDTASKGRDSVAAKMTSENIAKAQSMARECMASDYKNCGG